MSKIIDLCDSSGKVCRYGFYCPGCLCHHWFTTEGKISWTWNHDREKPTISPSIMSRTSETTICHSIIKDGMIQFLGDSFHELKSKTVLMEEAE